MKDETDPIVAEIRAVREKHAARFGYDVDEIFNYYKALQNTFGHRSARPPKLQSADTTTQERDNSVGGHSKPRGS